MGVRRGQSGAGWPRAGRRGMTLLEVVLAIAALGLVAASATTTMSYLYGAQVREQRRLAASEMAHRIILMHLDDPTKMPSGPQPYAKDFYRYELEVAPVRLTPKPHVASALADRRSSSPVSIDRLEQVTVRVWLSEESGGSRRFTSDVPYMVLVRLMDPQYVNRNPDSAVKFFDNKDRLQDFVQDVLGGGQ